MALLNNRSSDAFPGEASIELLSTTGFTAQDGEPIIMTGSILRREY